MCSIPFNLRAQKNKPLNYSERKLIREVIDMAEVNPLYVDGFFFYSSMYDDAVIGDFLRKISMESYSRAALYQHNMIGRVRDRFTGKIVYPASCGNLKLDNNYNQRVGLPIGSYTVKIPHLIIPYSDKKRFIRKYGYDNAVIPIEDFYKEDKIFDKYPVVNVGPHRIMGNIAFVLNRDRTVTMAICEPKNGSPISAKHIVSELREDDQILVFLCEPSQMYHVGENQKEENLFTEARINAQDTTIGSYLITIPYSGSKLNDVAPQVQHNYYNSWDMIINGTSSGNEPYTTTAVVSFVYVDKVHDEITFVITTDSLDALKARLNVSEFKYPFDVWFVERPNRRTISAYEYSPTDEPIMNLQYNENPAGNINIEVYECDEHYHKGRRLYDPELVQLHFPNIFNFTSLNKNHSDLLIEVIEYPSTYTNEVMHNSLAPLIDSLGQDFYTEFVVNRYDVNLDGTRANVRDFHPQHYPVSFEDYMNSPYYKNIRGYLLDKVVKTMATDPWLISEYYRLMNSKNQKMVTVSGTPRKLDLTIDGELDGEFSAPTEVVMDTSCASQNADDILHFKEPHTYLRFRSSEQQVPGMLYFNGKYVRPTATRYWNGLNYMFVPCSKIAQMKEDSIRTHDSDDVSANGKLLMESCAPVTLDFFPGAHTLVNQVASNTFTVESMEDVIYFFENLQDEKISIQELVFYDTTTKEILTDWLNLFDVVLELESTEYTSYEGNELLKVEKGKPVKYLLTLMNEIFCTADSQAIIIKEDPDHISFSRTIQELVDTGAITESEAYNLLDKKVDPKNIYLMPKDVSVIGKTITVIANNYKTEISVKGSTFEHIEGVGYHRFIDNATIDYFPSDTDHWRNFMIFKNGKYISGAKVTPSKFYEGALEVMLPETANVEDSDDVVYVHLPIRILQESFKMAGSVRYMKPGDTSKASISTIWPIDNDYTNGVAFEGIWDRTDSPMLPFEADENMKFTLNGYRMPPMSKSTYNARHLFYDANRTKYMSPAIKADINKGNGTVCAMQCAVPITRWEDHRDKDPLDIIW